MSPSSLLDRLLPSVGRKVALAVTLVLFFVAGGFALLANMTGGLMLDRQVEQRGVVVADFMDLIIEHEMLEGTPDHARQALERAVGTGLVRSAFLLNSQGTVRYAVPPDADPGHVDLRAFRKVPGQRGQLRHTVDDEGTQTEVLLMPIRKKPVCRTCHPDAEAGRGYVGLAVSRDDMTAVAADHRRLNALMGVAGFAALGGVLYWILALVVIRPLRGLHRHVAAVRREVPLLAPGTPMRLAHLKAGAGRDEIAGLAREFNGLVDQLNEANARLLRLTNDRLEKAERLSSAGQMAASVAHEIRNPVAGVRGALEIFEADIPPGDERRAIVTEMKLQLDRVNHAISDLLAYARPTPPLFGHVRVRDLVERTLGLFRRQTDGRGIDLRSECSLNGEAVLADGNQIQQVLWNLLLNAMQAMPSGGVLTVTAVSDAGHVEVTIDDTGIGMPPEVLDRVREPFFTTRHTGTGLGMTISQRIVDQHGGTLDIRSAPGAGTRVTIRLPRVPAQEGA